MRKSRLTVRQKNAPTASFGEAYAGFDETEQSFVYIGGPYYQSSAQLHLNEEEAAGLRDWLNKWVPKKKPKARRSKG